MPTGKVQKIHQGRPPDYDDPDDKGGLDIIVQVGLTSIKIYYEGICKVGDVISFDESDVYSATMDTFYDLRGFLENFGEFREAPIKTNDEGLEVQNTEDWKFEQSQSLTPEHSTFTYAIIDKLRSCINVSFADGVASLEIPPNLHPSAFNKLYELGMLHERFRWKFMHELDAIKGQKFTKKTPPSEEKRIDAIKDIRKNKLRTLKSRLRERGHYPEHGFSSRAALGRYILADTDLSSITNVEKRALDSMLKEIFET